MCGVLYRFHVGGGYLVARYLQRIAKDNLKNGCICYYFICFQCMLKFIRSMGLLSILLVSKAPCSIL